MHSSRLAGHNNGLSHATGLGLSLPGGQSCAAVALLLALRRRFAALEAAKAQAEARLQSVQAERDAALQARQTAEASAAELQRQLQVKRCRPHTRAGTAATVTAAIRLH